MSKSLSVSRNVELTLKKSRNTTFLFKELLPLVLSGGKKSLKMRDKISWLYILVIPMIFVFIFYGNFILSNLAGKILFFFFLSMMSLIMFLGSVDRWTDFLNNNYRGLANYLANLTFNKITKKRLRDSECGVMIDDVWQIAKILGQNNYVDYTDDQLLEIYSSSNNNNELFLSLLFNDLLKTQSSWVELDLKSDENFEFISNVFFKKDMKEEKALNFYENNMFTLFFKRNKIRKQNKIVLKEKRDFLVGVVDKSSKVEKTDDFVDKRYID